MVAADRPAQILILLPTPLEAAASSATIARWADPSAPSPLDFQTIVAWLPSAGEATAAPINDLRVALDAGVQILLIVDSESDPSIVSTLTGIASHRLSRPTSGSRLRIIDPRFQPHLSSIRAFNVVFSPTPEFESIADLGTSATSIALSCPAKGVFILPSCAPPSLDVLLSLVAAAEKPRVPPERERREVAAIYRATLALLVAATAITTGRYLQRSNNLRTLQASQSISVDPSQSPLLERLDEADARLGTIRDLKSDAIPVDADYSGELVKTIQLAHALGLRHYESQLLGQLADHNHLTSASDELDSYAEIIEGDMWDAFGSHRYEDARTSAQRYINIISAMPPGDWQEDRNRQLNAARKVVRLTDHNFLYGDSILVRHLGAIITGDTTSDSLIVRLDVADSSLVDDLAYAHAVVHSRRAPLDSSLTLWRHVAATAHDPRLAEAASFNLGRSVIAQIGRPGERLPPGALRKLAKNYFEQFISDHPLSYLADDALLFLVRLNVSSGHSSEALAEFGAMLKQYPRGDSTKRLEYIVWTLVSDSLGVEDNRIVTPFLLTAARDAREGLRAQWPEDRAALLRSLSRLHVLSDRLGGHAYASQAASELLAKSVTTHWPERYARTRDH